MQAQITNKLRQLNLNNPLQSLKQYLTVRPVGSVAKSAITQDLEALQSILSKIPQKQFEPTFRQLSEQQCQLLIDYIHRYMQFVGENQANIIAGHILSVYKEIVNIHGPTIILNSIARNDAITNRLVSYNQ